MKKNTKVALRWIVKVLRKRKIPFYISGGFAAKIYGSSRALNDIDIDIPGKYFDEVWTATKRYMLLKPARYLKKPWDVCVFTLRVKGQDIDISNGESIRFFNKQKQKWVRGPVRFNRPAMKKVFGMILPVYPKKDLLYYKRILEHYSSRKHQRADVKALSSS